MFTLTGPSATLILKVAPRMIRNRAYFMGSVLLKEADDLVASVVSVKHFSSEPSDLG